MIEKKNYSDQIFEHFFNEIRCGRITPGQKLPNERLLAEELGVSRPPLREALKSLSQIGLLTTRHGGGTFVNHYDADFLHSILKYISVINMDLVDDLIQARKALESESAKLASLKATDKDLQNMLLIIQKREELTQGNIGNYDAVRERLNALDFDFHNAVAVSSKNKIFIEFIKAIRNTISLQQNQAARASTPDKANKYHREIYNAIKDKKPKLAYDIMYEHIRSIEDAIYPGADSK